MLDLLNEEYHLGLLNSLLSLLFLLAKRDRSFYQGSADYCLLLLARLQNKDEPNPTKGEYLVLPKVPQDYLYYRTPCPWLQVKILRVLQLYPPPSAAAFNGRMNETLRKILHKSESKSLNTNNTNNSILFEAVNLVIAHGSQSDTRLRYEVIKMLGTFLENSKQANLRYLALDAMVRVAATTDSVEAGALAPEDQPPTREGGGEGGSVWEVAVGVHNIPVMHTMHYHHHHYYPPPPLLTHILYV
jgi:AP-2 complex subunit alpha